MTIKITVTIDEKGQILLPVEVNQKLNLQDNDWFKVNIESDHIVLTPQKTELDDNLLDMIIHEGILIDVK